MDRFRGHLDLMHHLKMLCCQHFFAIAASAAQALSNPPYLACRLPCWGVPAFAGTCASAAAHRVYPARIPCAAKVIPQSHTPNSYATTAFRKPLSPHTGGLAWPTTPMVRLLIGHTPGGVDRERYRAAWIGHAQAVLRQAAAMILEPLEDPVSTICWRCGMTGLRRIIKRLTVFR
jgi:hypothetical protein